MNATVKRDPFASLTRAEKARGRKLRAAGASMSDLMFELDVEMVTLFDLNDAALTKEIQDWMVHVELPKYEGW